jgi:hypothetical protein
MAYNFARPYIFNIEDTPELYRRFLDHPSANLYDARLVATNELLAIRIPLGVPWQSATREPPDLERLVDVANHATEEWYMFWRGFFSAYQGYCDELSV